MNFSIRIKIIIVVTLISLILFSILAYNNITQYKEVLEDSYVEKAKSVAYAMDANIGSKGD